MHAELVAAVDDAVIARTRARDGLAADAGDDYGIGDQPLFESEVKVGALARELDGFVDVWKRGGRDADAAVILQEVKAIMVEPGSYDAHKPG
jgi:hypothetical protein